MNAMRNASDRSSPTTTVPYRSFALDSQVKPDVVGVTQEERAVRVDLAAAYRLCALFGWDDLIYTHISARIPGQPGHFLVNPLGLGFSEITASSLVKIDYAGNVIGSTPYRPNAAGFVIHGCIHEARSDVDGVMHLHTVNGMALSMLRGGLLPLTQHALRFYQRIGYHDYEGIALSMGERERLVAALGPHNALILRNHGTLTAGRSVGAAFVEMYYLEKAAQAQLLAQSTGDALIHPSAEVCALTDQQWQANFGGANQQEWSELLRRLDRIDRSYRD